MSLPIPPRVKDLSGRKFGKLTVIGFSRILGNKSRWTCLCDCGSTSEYEGVKLSKGNTASCGCYNHNGCALYEWAYRKIKRDASNRGIEVTLTFQEYLAFVGYGCHYCDISLLWKKRNIIQKGGHNIDRKDNSLGYSIENCVPCCGPCNYIKGSNISYELMVKIGRVIKEDRLTQENKNEYKKTSKNTVRNLSRDVHFGRVRAMENSQAEPGLQKLGEELLKCPDLCSRQMFFLS